MTETDRTFIDHPQDEPTSGLYRSRPHQRALPPGTVIFEPDPVIERVAKAFGLKPAVLSSPDRTRHVSEARDAVYWLLRRHTRMGYKQLAITLRRRDHAGAVVAVQRAEVRRLDDTWFRTQLDAIEHELEQLMKGAA